MRGGRGPAGFISRHALKVWFSPADNLNNGGLQTVKAGKASVTAS
jgi:hypothetical protein